MVFSPHTFTSGDFDQKHGFFLHTLFLMLNRNLDLQTVSPLEFVPGNSVLLLWTFTPHTFICGNSDLTSGQFLHTIKFSNFCIFDLRSISPRANVRGDSDYTIGQKFHI
jgi:hypothetical protein